MRTAFALGTVLVLAAGCSLFAADGAPGDPLATRLERYRQGLAPMAAAPTPRSPSDAAALRELTPLRVAERPQPLSAVDAPAAPESLEPVPSESSLPEPAAPNAPATTKGPHRVSVLRKDQSVERVANVPARVGESSVTAAPSFEPAAAPTPKSAPVAPAGPFAAGSAPAEVNRAAELSGSSRRTAALPKPASTTTPRSVVTTKPGTPHAEKKAASESLFAIRGPALNVETIGPKQLSVGKPAAYVLKLTNAGGSQADEVTVFVGVPDSVEVAELRATSGQAKIEEVAQGTARLKWTLDRLAAAGEEQLIVNLVAKGSGAVTLEAGWTFRPAYVQTPIAVVEPRLTVAVSGPRELAYGDTKVYTVTLTNPGTGDAENVSIELVPTSASQPSAETNRVGTLKAGEQKQLELELTAREAGPLAIRVKATAEGNLTASAEEQVVVRRGRLNIVASSPPLAFAGTVAEYVIKVQNVGDAPVDGVTAVAILPQGAKLASNLPGATFDAPRGRLSWKVGLLPPGTEKAITIPCQLAHAGANRVEVQAAAGDLTAAGGTATDVESLADLKLTVNDPAGPVAVGAETTYTIRLVNRGTKAAERIEVRAIFSEGVAAVNVSGGRADLAANVATFQPIARINPGQEVVLSVSARASRGGNHVFRAEVDCRDPETKLVSQQTTRFYGDVQAPTPAAAAAPALVPPAAAPRQLNDPRVGIVPKPAR